jgi:hypothetical protein
LARGCVRLGGSSPRDLGCSIESISNLSARPLESRALFVVHSRGFHLHDIFLSYGHDDLSTASRFAKGFEREGFTVWWDASLRSGEAFDAAIESALKGAKAVVVLWSRTSVQSRWVRAEATVGICDPPVF